MAYTTVADVEGLAPQLGRFTATSRPTRDQVETSILPDVERQVDAVLRSVGVTLPLAVGPSPTAWAWAQQTVAWGALALVIAARAIGATNPDEQGADWARKEFNRRLTELRTLGVDLLVDAPTTTEATETDGADLIAGSGLASESMQVEPALTRDQVF